jgi:type 1 glutamine amidotransferase
MTDTMYNSRRAPYVSHLVGTDLVAEHIEKYWCPTITSADLLGGEPFRFQHDKRPHVVLVLGEHEYRTWQTLPEYAHQALAWRGLTCEIAQAPSPTANEFTNWQAIAKADLLLLSVRRRTPPKPMLDAIRAHLESNKPLVALRTSSHAFAAQPSHPEQRAWETFDQDVLGAKYEGHHGNDLSPRVEIRSDAAAHPVVKGLPASGFRSAHSLYRSRKLANTTQALLTGTIVESGQTSTEPVAWVNTNANRRVFYTSLGGPEDFKEPAFQRLLLNGILWSLDLPIPPE